MYNRVFLKASKVSLIQRVGRQRNFDLRKVGSNTGTKYMLTFSRNSLPPSIFILLVLYPKETLIRINVLWVFFFHLFSDGGGKERTMVRSVGFFPDSAFTFLQSMNTFFFILIYACIFEIIKISFMSKAYAGVIGTGS